MQVVARPRAPPLPPARSAIAASGPPSPLLIVVGGAGSVAGPGPSRGGAVASGSAPARRWRRVDLHGVAVGLGRSARSVGAVASSNTCASAPRRLDQRHPSTRRDPRPCPKLLRFSARERRRAAPADKVASARVSDETFVKATALPTGLCASKSRSPKPSRRVGRVRSTNFCGARMSPPRTSCTWSPSNNSTVKVDVPQSNLPWGCPRPRRRPGSTNRPRRALHTHRLILDGGLHQRRRRACSVTRGGATPRAFGGSSGAPCRATGVLSTPRPYIVPWPSGACCSASFTASLGPTRRTTVARPAALLLRFDEGGRYGSAPRGGGGVRTFGSDSGNVALSRRARSRSVFGPVI